ncbi:MAG: MlaD family protein [Flavobacteriaceae bacterium]
MKISRELKTGVVSVVIIAISIWGYNFLKGQNLFKNTSRTYFAEYNDIKGLNTASAVTINGYQVGKVVGIEFNENLEKRGTLVVEFGVENDFKFSKESVARIYSASLMGGMSLAIDPSYDGENAVSGDYLRGHVESDMLSSLSEELGPLQAKLESVIVNADSLLVGLNQVLDKNSRENLRKTFESLNKTMNNFEQVSESLDGLLVDNKEKLDNSLNNLEVMTDNFAKLSDSLANANLGQTIAKLETTITSLNSILGGLENGEGSIGKLLKDDGLYINLENASKELEELLREVKEHPKRYTNFSLFEKKDKGYQPKEEVEKQ